MKRSISVWQFLGFATTAIGGTLLHFLYEWTGENRLASLVSGVNESTWEHMKLLFFPLFVFAVIESCFFKDEQSFWCIKLIGTLLGLTTIPVLFYTYNGAFGKSPDWLNITIFFVSAALTFYTETRLFKGNKIKCKYPIIPFILLVIIAFLFVIFTFIPPEIPLFRDPITGTFGI